MKRDESLLKLMQINFFIDEFGGSEVNIQIKKQIKEIIFDGSDSSFSSKTARLDILNRIFIALGEALKISRDEMNFYFEKTKSDMEYELIAEWEKIEKNGEGDWN